ncbi:hypothetical protein HDE69_001689 [Pedobacter cryoconitis]|uniref:Uncharacterized protein n=1 Tax=Pedobacter cryoconitis TaxID=188932 RepID=A0A7W8YSF3_9SPHI|nr:hypothetical protein [Pedobacter cryoconitis]MBB5620640.1 hypothetical protein [Pedobacter cryoconitis]
MRFKYYIIFSLVLLFFKGVAQNDTSSFKYRKPLFDFNYQKPVFKLQNEQLSNKHRFLRFSVVTGYREGVKQGPGPFGLNFTSSIDTVTGLQILSMYNLSIADIVTHGMVRRNEIFLEVDDPSKYIYDPKYGDKENWMRKNAYCYELALPLGTIKGVNTLDEYLANLFGVKFGMEKRLVKALILVRTSTLDKLKSAGKGEGKYDMKGYFNNVPIDRLNHPLAEAGLPPMVDETGYKDPIDMNLKIDSWTDLPALRTELHRYDLDLIDGMRELEMFVIKKSN